MDVTQQTMRVDPRVRRLATAMLSAVMTLAVLLPLRVTAEPAHPQDDPSPQCVPVADAPRAGRLRTVTTDVVAGSRGRLTSVTVRSRALGARSTFNVLLPPGYTHDRHYPVLYLLHGAADSYAAWSAAGNVQSIVDSAIAAGDTPPFITVMPDVSPYGFYTDWYGIDVDGHVPSPAPGWETFHINELIPYVDATYSTVKGRRGRAVAGLSMGGYGAMAYATRHPDLFAAAGAFSGAVNLSYVFPASSVVNVVSSFAFTAFQGMHNCIFGDWATQQVRWRGQDPVELARNLAGAGTSLYLACGGVDADRPGVQTDPLEQLLFQMNQELVRAFDSTGVAHRTHFYPGGTHSWPYWKDELARFLPQMGDAFRNPPQPPSAFAYRTIEENFSVWGWDFAMRRDVTEILELSGVSPRGLTALGSGTLGVTTPGLYEPGRRYHVDQDSGSTRIRADQHGRLAFTVDLGPSHTTQQRQFDPAATATWTRSSVTITPLEK